MLFISPFLLILGLIQLVTVHKRWYGVSLTGHWRWPGYLIGGALFLSGAFLLPDTPLVLAMVLPAAMLGMAGASIIGSWASRGLDAAHFLRPGDWPEGRCQAVRIPYGQYFIPGLFIAPPEPTGAAICLVHGSGDNKTAFKWRLIRALLKQGLSVLTVDLAGHGENPTPQRWPDCTGEIPAALAWLRSQPGVMQVGLLGISMGGALSAHAAATAHPDTLILCETPISLDYSRAMVWSEVWHLLRSPVLDLLGEITPWQIRRIWAAGYVRREITLTDLLHRLDVPGQVARLKCPLYLVYGQLDDIAPPDHGQRLLQAASVPCRLTIIPGASHLTLILMSQTTNILAEWMAQQLGAQDR